MLKIYKIIIIHKSKFLKGWITTKIKSEADWQAEDDARVLINAEAIKRDKKRLKRALKKVDERIKEEQRVLQSAKQVKTKIKTTTKKKRPKRKTTKKTTRRKKKS